jgi:hypothetical protein
MNRAVKTWPLAYLGETFGLHNLAKICPGVWVQGLTIFLLLIHQEIMVLDIFDRCLTVRQLDKQHVNEFGECRRDFVPSGLNGRLLGLYS